MDHDVPAYGQKEVDNGNEAGQPTENCLSNAVIIRTILKDFPTAELRRLSLVNKAWKHEAQSILRKRGHFTAYVKSKKKPYYVPRLYKGGESPHDEVDAFISYLKQVNPVPFSGISLDVCFDIGVGPSPTEALDPDPLEGVILDLQFLRTVSVKLHGLWLLINMTSPGVLLTKKVLEASSGVLEELSLSNDCGRRDFVEHVVQDISFPQLKILKLMERNSRPDEEGHGNYMKALLSRAPNLNMLHTDCPLNLIFNFLEGSTVVPVYTSPVAAPFDEVPENIISAIRLDTLELKYTGLGFDFERFNRITPMLLEASCTTTLRSMWLDAVLAVPLMSYGICLENVKHLNMDIDYEHLERYGRPILSIVKDFDFTRIFPNLNKVKVVAPHFTLGHMQEVIEQVNFNLREPLLDRAANVKELYLKQRNLSSEAAQYFAEMFPNIEKLEIITSGIETISFESIWKNWPDLKELKVRANMLGAVGNLDSVFCGIFPEEVANLKLRYDEYLKRVNIVPVMPSLTCMKNLRVLSLNLKQPRDIRFGDDATFLFSEVTPLLSFARCPALTVTLKVSYPRRLAAPPAMAHLMPYVSITSDYLEYFDG